MTETNSIVYPHGAHLVGSIPLSSAEEVFRSVSTILKDRIRRLPDGETGIRTNWIGWQNAVFSKNPNLSVIPPDPQAYSRRNRFTLRNPNDAHNLQFSSLGYAQAAQDSYRLFSRLKQEGIIPPQIRFQVCLPTPLAPMVTFFKLEDQALVEPAYEQAMQREVVQILATIPAQELALQWDTAIEFAVLEGVMPSFINGNHNEAILQRLLQLGKAVPPEVELGYHLCYGDAGHRHFVEPKDTSKLVQVANALASGIGRPLNWLHLPVPKNRTDNEYFAPLRDLNLQPETELYLGLVHYTDGVGGAQKRIASAQKIVKKFGVATECGMGRRAPETIPALLEIHRQVSAPLS